VTRKTRAGGEQRSLAAVAADWTHRDRKRTGQKLVFNHVAFQTDETLQPDDRVTAVYTGVDDASRDNWLVMNHCLVDGRFTTAVSHNRGGNWLIQNCYLNAETAYQPKWTPNYYYNLHLSGNTLGP